MNHSFRAVAHWAGVTIGVVGGLWLFWRFGVRALFTASGSESWLQIVTGVVMFSTLPLSILGIFKPRAAAWGISASLVILVLGLAILTVLSPQKWEFGYVLRNFVLVPGLVAALLFYGSRRDTTAASDGVSNELKTYLDRLGLVGKRKQAQWAAVIIGLVAGAWRFPSSMFPLQVSLRNGDWLGVAGITATTLTLLPLSILAIFKPRLAAFTLLLSLAVAIAYPLVVFPPFRFGWTQTLSGMFFALLLGFPLALMAGLLFYATSGSRRDGQHE